MRSFEKISLMLIFLLVIPFAYAQSCIDSDGGLNYNERGCVKFYGIENFICDRCIPDSKSLIEVDCDGDNINFTKYDCPNGCEDDKCIPTTTTTTTLSTTTTISTTSTTTTIPSTTTTTSSIMTTTTSTTTSIVEPCSREGDFCPTDVENSDDITGYCVRKEYYNSHNNWFKSLTGDYSCGNDYCCVACSKDDCCWDLRGYCYSFDDESSTGCLADGNVSEYGYSHKCGENNGEECVDDTTGYSLIDPSGEPPYGQYKCVSSMPSSTSTTTTTETTMNDSFTTTTSINVITTTTNSGSTTSTTTITHSTCTGTNIYACYKFTNQSQCELKTCCYWANGACEKLSCSQLSENKCSACLGCYLRFEISKTTTTTSEPTLKSTTTTTLNCIPHLSACTPTGKPCCQGSCNNEFCKVGGGGHNFILSLTNITVIAVIIALVVLAIIFGVMKLTRSKSSEPKQQYNEENRERSFY